MIIFLNFTTQKQNLSNKILKTFSDKTFKLCEKTENAFRRLPFLQTKRLTTI